MRAASGRGTSSKPKERREAISNFSATAPWGFCCSRVGGANCLRYWSSVGGRGFRVGLWRDLGRGLFLGGEKFRGVGGRPGGSVAGSMLWTGGVARLRGGGEGGGERRGWAWLSMAGMAAIWAARVWSMDGTDWARAWVARAMTRSEALNAFRIMFL